LFEGVVNTPNDAAVARKLGILVYNRLSQNKGASTESTREIILRALRLPIVLLVAASTSDRPDLIASANALIDLYKALEDLDDGLVAPLLRPKPIHHRPPTSRYVTAVQVYSAAACNALIDLNLNATQAARRVAGALNDCGFSIGARSISGLTILNWRRKYRDTDKLTLLRSHSHLFRPAFALAEAGLAVEAQKLILSILTSTAIEDAKL